jgi:hypothetical protein
VELWSVYPNEEEVLFAPETRFRVLATKTNPSSEVREIFLREIVQGVEQK